MVTGLMVLWSSAPKELSATVFSRWLHLATFLKGKLIRFRRPGFTGRRSSLHFERQGMRSGFPRPTGDCGSMKRSHAGFKTAEAWSFGSMTEAGRLPLLVLASVAANSLPPALRVWLPGKLEVC